MAFLNTKRSQKIKFIYLLAALLFSVSLLEAQNKDDIRVEVVLDNKNFCFGEVLTIDSVIIGENGDGAFGRSTPNSNKVLIQPPTGFVFIDVYGEVGLSKVSEISVAEDDTTLSIDNGAVEFEFITIGTGEKDTLIFTNLKLAPIAMASFYGDTISVKVDLPGGGDDSTHIFKDFIMDQPTITDFSLLDGTKPVCEYNGEASFEYTINNGGKTGCPYDTLQLFAWNIDNNKYDTLQTYSGSFATDVLDTLTSNKIRSNYKRVKLALKKDSLYVFSNDIGIITYNSTSSAEGEQVYYHNITSTDSISLVHVDRSYNFENSGGQYSYNVNQSKIRLTGLLDGWKYYPYETEDEYNLSEYYPFQFLRNTYFDNEGAVSMRFESEIGEEGLSHQDYIETRTGVYNSEFSGPREYAQETWIQNSFLSLTEEWLSYEKSDNTIYCKEIHHVAFNTGSSSENAFINYKRINKYASCISYDSVKVKLIPDDIHLSSILCAADTSTQIILVTQGISEANEIYYPSGTSFSHFEAITVDEGTEFNLPIEHDTATNKYTFHPSEWYDTMGDNRDRMLIELRSLGTYEYYDVSTSNYVKDTILIYKKTVSLYATRTNSELTDLDETLCYDTNAIRLSSNYTLDSAQGDGTSKPNEYYNDWYFTTSAAFDSISINVDSVLVDSFKYFFTDDRGCTGETYFNYTIIPPPKTKFITENSCFDTLPIKFVDSTKVGAAGSISSYTWAFGDGTIYSANLESDTIPNSNDIPLTFDVGRTSGVLSSPTHKYQDPGEYIVSLYLNTESGCGHGYVDTLRIEEYPEPHFNYEHIGVNQDSILFINTSDSSSFETNYVYSWNFGNDTVVASDSNGGNFITYYLAHGIYPVKLIATTGSGCIDSVTVNVPVFPFVKVVNDPVNYNFTTNRGWYNSDLFDRGENSGWQTIPVAGNYIDSTHLTDVIWMTGSDTLNKFNERSWVESPCFDISELNFPMVSFDIFQSVQEGSDGAVFQYTLNDGNTWKNVGTINQGQNWYNTKNIASTPGDQDAGNEGWSANLNTWLDARFAIDDIREELIDSNAACVRFRFAYGSNGDNGGKTGYEGFAFTNFEIGQRKRVVLLEEFINSAYAGYSASNYAALDTFVANRSVEVCDIRYHMVNGYAKDPLYSINQWDNSARASEYGAKADGPKAMVDGVSEVNAFDYSSEFNLRSLKTPMYDIDNVNLETDGGALNISATIRKKSSLRDNEIGRQLVRVAIVQKSFIDDNNQEYKNVLVELLPNGVGNVVETLPEDFGVGEEIEINTSWIPNVRTVDSDFRIIIYVQSEWGIDEVQQVYFKDVSVMDVPQVYTAVNTVSLNDDFSFYPNPIKDVLFIGTNNQSGNTLEWTIYSVDGAAVNSGVTSINQHNAVVDVAGLRSGMYIIEVVLADGESVNHKLIKY